MSDPALPRFDIVVEALDDAAFRLQLEALLRAGVELTVDPPLTPGVRCQLHITSRDGGNAVTAEAVVTKVLGPNRQQVTPTRFGPIASHPRATSDLEQLQIEGSRTAALPSHGVSKVIARAGQDSGEKESSLKEGSALGSAMSNPANPKGSSGPPELEPFEALGNYQVLRHLGGGGMAEVYLARSLLGQGVDKLVALKTAREGFGPLTPHGAMFLDEARVSATLQHPNLVQVFDFGEAAGRPYLAMEFVAGRDLSAVLKALRARKTPAPPAVVVAIGIALCRALEYVHEKRDAEGRALNLVHRDVGPANLMLTTRSELKLMDFGVAASVQTAGSTLGLMVGKLPYMPAEQLLGQDPIPSWDLYAAAVTLFQLATLFHPYKGNPLEYLPTPALRFHRGPPSGANPALSPAMDALLIRATQLEAADRPAQARELREELERAQQETGPADLGAWLGDLFGAELEQEETQAQALLVEGRRRSALQVPAFLRPVLAPFEAVRRKVVYSETYRRLARRPWVLRGLVLGALALVLAGGGAGLVAHREQEAIRSQVAKADAHVLAGRLVSAGTDDALDVLLEAKTKWPADARVTTRLSRIADRFEAIGAIALERGNLEEAAAHLEASLRAEPGRTGAVTRLKAVEEKVRERSRARVLQSP